jgi:hypothetical protein
VAGAATAGQVPSTFSSARQPWPSAASTTGSTDGLLARCGDSGTRAVHSPPFHAWVQAAAVAMTSGVSGKKSSVLPRSATGRPCTLTASASPSMRTWLSGRTPPTGPMTGRGRAASAASNTAPFRAVEPRSGMRSANSPSCGIHSWRQTSQAALSLTSSVSLPTGGLKSGVMVSGTGSSTVPS